MIKFACIPCRAPLTSDVYPDLDCRVSNARTVQDPPLLFDLYRDTSEVYALSPADPVYNQTICVITEVLWTGLHNFIVLRIMTTPFILTLTILRTEGHSNGVHLIAGVFI